MRRRDEKKWTLIIDAVGSNFYFFFRHTVGQQFFIPTQTTFPTSDFRLWFNLGCLCNMIDDDMMTTWSTTGQLSYS